ncbi:hypothetical protein NGRA_3619, partial [Nosema granulosis]
NYITKKLISKINCKINRLHKPLERFTCLNEKFWIEEKATVDFKYKNINYREDFCVLPRRTDEFIILGKNWLKGLDNKYEDVECIEDIQILIEKLCEKNQPEKLKIMYAE